MKKFLPKTNSNSSGFTLIELMVVIAIVAILTVIGFATYNGVQGNARDAVKLSNINILAKNIESTKDPTTETYQYNSTLYARDFTTALSDSDPADAKPYCIKFASSAVTAPLNSDAGWTANACPAGWTTLKGLPVPASALTDTYFMVCAHAERAAKPICRGPFTK